MTDAERAFFRLLSELAAEGLFSGPERDGVIERITDAFEAAIEAAKREKPGSTPTKEIEPGLVKQS